ncbi:hypothetical protein NZK32_12850 [Cyanobium sp. FGCU-52]|nr:hypothetical protein [Cyanobium sp. FGCU52]
MSCRPLRLPSSLVLLPLLIAGSAAAAPVPEPPATPPAGALTPVPAVAPSVTPGTTPPPSSKEQQVLERIRQMKAPRWRSFGVCRYDWGGWRMSEAGVRATAAECGEPSAASSVAVHCDTLRVARRIGDGPWEPWRLPLSTDESKTLGGEDRMVANLCANLAPSAPAAPAAGTRSGQTRPLKVPPPATPPAPAGGKARTKAV